MSSIKDRLLAPEVRPLLVTDCVNLIDHAVKSTKGFTGIAVKGAYSSVKMIKPRFVDGVVDALLDEWIEKLVGFEAEHTDKRIPGPLSAYLVQERVRVSEALIAVTDARAETTKHKTAAKFYHRLRPSALSHVEQAIPELAALVDKYGAGAPQAVAAP
jgi:hypothetical protein